MLKGIAVSDGIVIAKAYKYELPEIIIPTRNKDTFESDRVNQAIEKTKQDYLVLKNIAFNNLKIEDLAIFDAYISMLSDPLYLNEIEKGINSGYIAEVAIKEATDNIIANFENIEDKYIKERICDIKDISYRVLCNALGLDIPDLLSIDKESIIIADDLSFTDIALIDLKLVLGLACENSSITSHLSIAAKSMNLPTVVSCKNLMNNVNNGDTIILDGGNGDVIVNPTSDVIKEYELRRQENNLYNKQLESLIGKESITIDGHKVKLVCNITSSEDEDNIEKFDGEGVGLYRTEFLFLNNTYDFPNEEEQFKSYKQILSKNDNRVIIRTLDIGGDKKLGYFNFPHEQNPFLGYRAIRFCLDHKDIFKVQIRALLKASTYGKLGIMIPMISTIDEIRQTKEFIYEIKKELINEGIKISDDILIGMMIETPACAILADKFAQEVDFFSIGSNDLIQYTMAADRQSKEVSYLYQPLNPSVLRFIKLAIDSAHKYGKWCGMCGEMASDKNAIPLLVGMGLDELSMSPSLILKTRALLRNMSYEELKVISNKAIEMSSSDEVFELVRKFIK